MRNAAAAGLCAPRWGGLHVRSQSGCGPQHQVPANQAATEAERINKASGRRKSTKSNPVSQKRTRRPPIPGHKPCVKPITVPSSAASGNRQQRLNAGAYVLIEGIQQDRRRDVVAHQTNDVDELPVTKKFVRAGKSF